MALVALSRMSQNLDIKNQYGAYVDRLFNSCENGDLTSVTSLLQKRNHYPHDPHLALATRTYTGENKACVIRGAVYMLYIRLIDAAVLSGKPSVVKIIIKNKLHAKLDPQNLTPLHWLCFSRGHKEDLKTIVSLLCQNGYNINAVANRGYTPLHIACKFAKNVDAAKVLIDAGCDLNKQTQFGLTSLHICCSSSKVLKSRGNEIIIEYLLKNGADLSLRSKLNRTVADIVGSSNERTHILKMLITYGLDESMLSKGVPAFKLQRQLLRQPESWDIIIPLVEMGYRFKNYHIVEMQSSVETCKILEKKYPSLKKIMDLQSNVPLLQRLTANVVRTSLQPRFYPNLMKMDMLPSFMIDYILFKNMSSDL